MSSAGRCRATGCRAFGVVAFPPKGLGRSRWRASDLRIERDKSVSDDNLLGCFRTVNPEAETLGISY